MPPLRERNNDILELSEFFLARFANKYGKNGLRLSESALDRLKSYPWPGNIRELQHTLERASSPYPREHVLKPNDFPLHDKVSIRSADMRPDTLDEMEQLMITDALNQHDGNFTAAANQLGISRQTLYNKIKKMGKTW